MSFQDLILIGLLVFLEGVLSIDNALVLAMMVRHLPREKQRKALTYGLGGAVVFRLVALFSIAYLLRWTWLKFIGGAYLVFIASKHLLQNHGSGEHELPRKTSFWKTVAMIELMDIAFALDSILAAVALSSKLWIIFTGGFIGVILIRFAAQFFVRLLDAYPNLETTAYLLVGVIGIKVVIEGMQIEGIDFHSGSSPAFWIFWGIMVVCIGFGFKQKQRSSSHS